MDAAEEDATSAGRSSSLQERVGLLRTHPTSQERREVRPFLAFFFRVEIL